MRNSTIKKVFAATSVLAAMAFAGMASAHGLEGVLSGGVAPSFRGGQTDVWEIKCPAGEGAHHLVVSIANQSPARAPMVLFAAYKAELPFIVKGETDPIDNDGVDSRKINVNGGSGSYFIIVKKTSGKILPGYTDAQKLAAVAAQNYSLEVHCETSKNQHTNIDTQEEILRQNQ